MSADSERGRGESRMDTRKCTICGEPLETEDAWTEHMKTHLFFFVRVNPKPDAKQTGGIEEEAIKLRELLLKMGYFAQVESEVRVG